MENSITEDIEKCRAVWAKVAKENGWYKEPFYVQVFVDPDTNKVYDSVSFDNLTEDVIYYEKEEQDY